MAQSFGSMARWCRQNGGYCVRESADRKTGGCLAAKVRHKSIGPVSDAHAGVNGIGRLNFVDRSGTGHHGIFFCL